MQFCCTGPFFLPAPLVRRPVRNNNTKDNLRITNYDKNAQNKKNAEAFINYLCRPDIAKMNFDYITYSIPNSAGRELIEDESMRESNIAFPDISQLKNCETFNFLGDENEIIYNQLWREIKSK